MRDSLSTLVTFQERRGFAEPESFSPVQPVRTGAVGRPGFDVSLQQLFFLVENGFSVPQISDMIGVSVRTVRRRVSEFGLSIRAQYSTITNDELDRLVREFQVQYPLCGNRQMSGHLLSRGYRVQQNRVRESQRRVDPDGAIIRHLHVLNRREYSVPAPRSLYHIDGYHKLIRYVLFTFMVCLMW